MSFKKKVGLGIATAALGISLVGGGTYSYFSDREVMSSTFAAGTLDLSVDPSVLIDLNNMKPGDSTVREFVLGNEGSLKIENVILQTNYTVTDANTNNNDDLGKYIRVNFLWNWDKESEPIFETTLYDLKNMDPDVVKRDLWDPLWEQKGGLDPGASNELWVEFEFVENGRDQNMFQGDSLNLEWIFNANQTPGEEL